MCAACGLLESDIGAKAQLNICGRQDGNDAVSGTKCN